MLWTVSLCLFGGISYWFYREMKKNDFESNPVYKVLIHLMNSPSTIKFKESENKWYFSNDSLRIEMSYQNDELSLQFIVKPNENQNFNDKAIHFLLKDSLNVKTSSFFEDKNPELISFIRNNYAALFKSINEIKNTYITPIYEFNMFIKELSPSFEFLSELNIIFDKVESLLNRNELSFENKHFIQQTLVKDIHKLCHFYIKLNETERQKITSEVRECFKDYIEKLNNISFSNDNSLKQLELQIKIIENRMK